MGKSRHPRTDKEHSENQKLRRENDRLKKNLASLRRQLQRIDLDRYQNIKDIIEKHDREEAEKEHQESFEALKKKWTCKECSAGHLEIIIFNKLNEVCYYRQCSHCPHRTRAQRHHDGVTGLVKDTSVPKEEKRGR